MCALLALSHYKQGATQFCIWYDATTLLLLKQILCCHPSFNNAFAYLWWVTKHNLHVVYPQTAVFIFVLCCCFQYVLSPGQNGYNDCFFFVYPESNTSHHNPWKRSLDIYHAYTSASTNTGVNEIPNQIRNHKSSDQSFESMESPWNDENPPGQLSFLKASWLLDLFPSCNSIIMQYAAQALSARKYKVMLCPATLTCRTDKFCSGLNRFPFMLPIETQFCVWLSCPFSITSSANYEPQSKCPCWSGSCPLCLHIIVHCDYTGVKQKQWSRLIKQSKVNHPDLSVIIKEIFYYRSHLAKKQIIHKYINKINWTLAKDLDQQQNIFFFGQSTYTIKKWVKFLSLYTILFLLCWLLLINKYIHK